tara:strand:- start:11167 stop:13185 length:2019 start_codon:yes stop_codon:yes gene_type:complete
MIYQNPQLLYALLAIAIPIIIHLFNLRKHKIIYFSSIRFLKEIKDKKRRISRLRNILVLLSRILAIICLVLAFAKPYIPTDEKEISNNIFIYIDNSQSMDINFGDGNLLRKAKNKAMEICDAYTEEHNFYLITNDFLPKHITSYNNDMLKSQIEEIKSSPTQRSITEIVSRRNSMTNNENHLYFISDLQENTLKINDLKKSDLKGKISIIPIENKNITNISIDSLFALVPIFTSDYEAEVHVIISNTSSNNITDERLFLYLDNKQKSQRIISLLTNETKEITFKFLTKDKPFISAEIRTHDSPITFDNNLFFTLKKSKKINVTTINGERHNPAFDILFGNDSALFNFASLSIENINYNQIIKDDFIILNEIKEINSGLLSSLVSFVDNGGSLLIVPPSKLADLNAYNKALSSLGINTISSKIEREIKINQFSTKHPIYKNVFTKALENVNYPISNQTYILEKKEPSSQIIGFANKADFLSTYKSKKGNIYMFASPLIGEYNNFTRHALFVPTLINIALSSIQINQPYYTIGSEKEITIKNTNLNTEMIHLKGKNTDIIPTITNQNGIQSLNIHNQITENGIYSIEMKDQVLEKIAFNYKKSESKISSLSINQMKKFISKNNIENVNIMPVKNIALKTIIKEHEIGKEYWKLAIILSLLFFGIEILFIKLIKP